MGAADGSVVGTTKVVDHGPDNRRWNLVVLAEGFRSAELPSFHAATQAFIDELFATPPFRELWCAINIHRVDVASDESGADDPATCGDGSTGAGTTAATFFDARFCVNNTRRLLAGDTALVQSTATAQVPAMHEAVVIVNSTTYGGAGGSVAWFSLAPSASQIGIHELGHSAFGLTDEYTDVTDSWSDPEPPAPNATTITDRATTKWADLIDAGTPLPTTSNPDCTTTDTQASPVPAGTVGLFEGSARTRCGVYRPEHKCYMRVLGDPFCAVCRRTVRGVLRPFMPRTVAPTIGIQFTGSLPAGATRRWFTHSWPACWHVHWTVEPVTLSPGDADVRWRVQVERASREHLTYWLEVTNLEDHEVDVQGRYTILSRG